MFGSHARRMSVRGSLGVRAMAPYLVLVKPARDPNGMEADLSSATELLLRGGAGEASALERLVPLVYDELRRLAHRHLARESGTLGTTELVHEAYLKLIDQTRVEWSGRAHFLGVASIAMRRILVDRARRRRRLKHGGPLVPIPLDDIDVSADERADLVVALDEALDRLRILDERQARVVECRFFGGMSEEETAEVVGIGLRTAKREWAKARSWLYTELFGDPVT
jgi:RNA polymerase sigma factor (TIGR02999 family)